MLSYDNLWILPALNPAPSAPDLTQEGGGYQPPPSCYVDDKACNPLQIRPNRVLTKCPPPAMLTPARAIPCKQAPTGWWPVAAAQLDKE